MCVTLSRASLSKTVIYAGHAMREGQEVAVVAYQNRATSPGPNAMILPIPTATPMGPGNIIDTREARWFLNDLDFATRPRTRGTSKGGGMLLGARAPAQVFDSGSYTVVLADHADSIPEALERVPEAKRPRVAKSFFEDYGKLYPDWPIAVCCWSGTIEAEPLLWWYVPKFAGWLFFPTVDAHNGAPPIEQDVLVDHTLIWGAKGGAFKPWYRAQLPDSIDRLMAPAMDVLHPNGRLSNGDFWVREGSNPKRIFPNGGPP